MTSKIEKFQSDMPAGRQRYLALGRHYAAAIQQIRERGLPAALEAVDCMGGVTQRVSIARSLLRAVARAGDVPAYKILDRIVNGGLEKTVLIPHLTWKYTRNARGQRDRQVGKIEWLPMFSAYRRPAGSRSASSLKATDAHN